MFVTVEVESNPNCAGLPMLSFEAQDTPAEVRQVRVFVPRPDNIRGAGGSDAVCAVTGWSSAEGGTPCAAYWAPISDSGAGVAYLVYGGDWGLRLRPAGVEEEWDVENGRQWGEPFLVLSNREDVLTQASV